jgi:hypothetical protein
MMLAELIAQHCADLTDYEAIAARLNAPTTVANPVTEAPQVPHPPSLKEIYAAIPVAEAAAIYNKPGLSADIRNAIDSGDPEYLAMMLAIVLEMQIISAQTATALAMLLQRTQADPTWAAQIAGPSLAQAAGVGTVTAAQVQAVLA